MSTALSVFHALPYPLRVAAASIRGYTLKNHRYGRGFSSALEAVKERESWRPEQWKSWQESQLAELLHCAATRVPWYRRIWEDRRRKGDRAPWDVLANWPILEKHDLRANGRALVADDADFRSLQHVLTSGTTGTPTHLWISEATQKRWYAQFESRCRQWNGVSRHSVWAHLGGKQVASNQARTPPYWVWTYGLNQLYLSAYHLRPGNYRLYAEAMKKHKVRAIVGYASALYHLAKGCIEEGVTGLQLETAISDGEPAFEHYRRAIRQAFGCELRASYGMVEIAAAGSECSHGTLHSWPDTGIIETVNGSQSVTDGGVGDFLCTGLLNTDMPLIRYRNGDRGSFSGSPSNCACGRSLSAIAAIEGRVGDIIVTADGRHLSPSYVEVIFDEEHPIAEAQLIQRSLSEVVLRYVPLPGFDSKAESTLRRAVCRIVGDLCVTLEPMASLPRGPNGKFSAVISLMNENRNNNTIQM